MKAATPYLSFSKITKDRNNQNILADVYLPLGLHFQVLVLLRELCSNFGHQWVIIAYGGI